MCGMLALINFGSSKYSNYFLLGPFIISVFLNALEHHQKLSSRFLFADFDIFFIMSTVMQPEGLNQSQGVIIIAL